jgi:hypothetical protein
MIFTIGAAIGSVVTWKLVKTKYEKIAQEEIESVREALSTDEEKIDIPEEPDDDAEYDSIIRNEQYAEYVKEEFKKDEEVEDDMDKPYVISPEDFGDCDYPTISLDYYEGDDTLTDERGNIIANVDELVGYDFADHFGEYEDDSVFVRNDKLGVDYEILRDYRSYSEVD